LYGAAAVSASTSTSASWYNAYQLSLSIQYKAAVFGTFVISSIERGRTVPYTLGITAIEQVTRLSFKCIDFIQFIYNNLSIESKILTKVSLLF